MFNVQGSRFKGQGGFTLVELLLYLAIVGVIFGTLIPFAWNVIEGGTRSSVSQEVSSTGWFLMEKIKTKIRNAQSVTVGPNSLTIINGDGSTTMITAINDALQASEGSNPPVNLNSADTSITGVSFGDLQTAESKQVQIIFTVNSNYYQSRSEYQKSVTIESSAEVRGI